MWKRLMAALLICLSIFSFTTFGYATDSITVKAKPDAIIDVSKYEILKPEKTMYSTDDKTFLINGKAVPGTEITIDVYGTTDLTKKNFNLDKLPSEKDYIHVLTESINSGNIGFFHKQLELVKGINKVIINFNVEDLLPVEIIVYVYDREITTGVINRTRETRISELLPLLR